MTDIKALRDLLALREAYENSEAADGAYRASLCGLDILDDVPALLDRLEAQEQRVAELTDALELCCAIESATLRKAAEECNQIAAQQKRMYRDQQGAVECRNRLRALAEGKS